MRITTLLASAAVIAAIAAPAYAAPLFSDAPLIALMDSDGPAIRRGFPVDTGTPDDSPATASGVLSAKLSAAGAVEDDTPDCSSLFVYGSCSDDSWTDENPPAAYLDPETGVVMHRDDRTGVYFAADASQEEKDAYLDSDGDGIINDHDPDGVAVLCDEGYCLPE